MHIAKFEMHIERIEPRFNRAMEECRRAFVIAEMLLRNCPIEKCNGKGSPCESLVESSTSFRVLSKLLILDAEIEMRFAVGRFGCDFLQTQLEIKMPLCRNALFASNLSVVMKNYRNRS